MKTIAICNQKGGVGKSTLTYHLSFALAAVGNRVLVIDADPQGNITFALSKVAMDVGDFGLADVLSARTRRSARTTVVPTHFAGVDLLPTTGEALGVVRDELVVAGAGREARLKNALSTVRGHYDVCLIDCPPSLDQLTINALSAANEAVVVTHARLWSAIGLSKLLANIALVRQHYNRDLTPAGIILNQVETHTNAARHWQSEVAAHASNAGIPILWPTIPKRVAIADAIEYGQPIKDAAIAQIFDLIASKLTATQEAAACVS